MYRRFTCKDNNCTLFYFFIEASSTEKHFYCPEKSFCIFTATYFYSYKAISAISNFKFRTKLTNRQNKILYLKQLKKEAIYLQQ